MMNSGSPSTRSCEKDMTVAKPALTRIKVTLCV